MIAVIVLVPGLGDLRESFADAKIEWLIIAALLQFGSCLSYVAVFRAVFCTQMRYRTSFEIGMSELAANALLSVGGAGGLALGVWILKRGGMDTGHIARRTVAFFLITSLANVAFLILAGIGLASGALSGSDSLALALIPAAAGIGAIVLALAIRSGAGAPADRLQKEKLSKGLAALSDGITEAVGCCARAIRRSSSAPPATCSSTSRCSAPASRLSASRCRRRASSWSPTWSASSAT